VPVTDPEVPSIGRVALAVVGVALVLGGGYTVTLGVDGTRTCGNTVLVAGALDDVEAPGDENRVAFTTLTATQRTLADRAIDGERPTVDGGEWPRSESAILVEYQGTDYRFYTVTTECPFPPAAVLGVGVLGTLAGIGTLGLARRTCRRARVADPE
jgi:hypothetical protein